MRLSIHHLRLYTLTLILRTNMSTHREGPNPLRPYYIPPSVGPPADSLPHGTAAPNISSKYAPTSTSSFGTSARNILSDMDYSDPNSSPSPPDVIKRLIEQAMWKYTSVFLAQPFEVTKTILQVQVFRGAPRKDGVPDESRRQQRQDIYEVGLPTPSSLPTTTTR